MGGRPRPRTAVLSQSRDHTIGQRRSPASGATARPQRPIPKAGAKAGSLRPERDPKAQSSKQKPDQAKGYRYDGEPARNADHSFRSAKAP